MTARRAFDRTIGIDYSGGQTPITEFAELQVYCAIGNAPPRIVRPRRPDGVVAGDWTRRRVAEWLVREPSGTPALEL